jgi:hypothetical protein
MEDGSPELVSRVAFRPTRSVEAPKGLLGIKTGSALVELVHARNMFLGERGPKVRDLQAGTVGVPRAGPLPPPQSRRRAANDR